MTGPLKNAPDDPAPGEWLDFQHFRVPVEDGHPVELGRGAMGITYRAVDRNLRVPVALKVINPALVSGEAARERFLREARSAAALRHPNVATVLYLGEQEGSVFYAMEFIEGETVEAFIRRENAMPPTLALTIVAQVASALAAAEKEGIIHRDIKPSNIMLVHGADGDVRVKVIDFGLAKSVESTPDSATVTLTQGGFLGTPHFASPEQLEEREVDTRSDIYSLGVTLFYMLAGKTPFSGSMAQVMSQHLYRQPPIELLADQPEPVMRLLTAMLAKAPEERPQTAVELKRRVDACLEEISGSRSSEGAAATLPEARGGDVLAGRFTLAEKVGQIGEFLRFRATDGDRPDTLVEVVFAGAQAPSIPGLAENLRLRVAAVERVEAVALRRVIARGSSERGWFYAAEWLVGTRLLDVMRARRALPLAEALVFLRPLAAALDALEESRVPRPTLALHEVVLLPARDPATGLDQWPGLQVKVDAVRLECMVEQPGDVTVVASSVAVLRRDAGATEETAAFELAGLAYEVLGGTRFDAVHDRWTPLAEVPAETNQVLERALRAAPEFATATEFVAALAASAPVGSSGRPTRPPAPPPLPPISVHPGKSHAPILLIGGGVALLLLIAVVGALLLLAPRIAPPSTGQTKPTPTATPIALASPTASPTPAPEAAALAEARGLESRGEIEPALSAYARVLEQFPNNAEASAALARVAAAVEGRHPEGLPGESLPTVRGPLEVAARLGSASAQVLLGNALFEEQPEQSLAWMTAAAKQGRTDAMVRAGQMLSNAKGVPANDFEQAASWFQQAAQAGDVDGMVYLADCQLRGLGVPRDAKRASEVLETAVALGDPRAMDMLANLYRKGDGVPADSERAFALYQRAADGGDLNAQANLGVLYVLGEGVKRDAARGAELWRQGADAGHPRSMFLYAMALEDRALLNNRREAREWYVAAAQAGHDGAIAWCKTNGVEVPPPTPTPTPTPPGPEGSDRDAAAPVGTAGAAAADAARSPAPAQP